MPLMLSLWRLCAARVFARCGQEEWLLFNGLKEIVYQTRASLGCMHATAVLFRVFTPRHSHLESRSRGSASKLSRFGRVAENCRALCNAARREVSHEQQSSPSTLPRLRVGGRHAGGPRAQRRQIRCLPQPPDVILTILMELDATCLSRAACSCRQLPLHPRARGGALAAPAKRRESCSPPRQSPTDWRWLYWRLSGTLEVRGWADEHAVNAGENLAWWRCRAVGYDGVRVKVRFLGYEKEDDEWRSVARTCATITTPQSARRG